MMLQCHSAVRTAPIPQLPTPHRRMQAHAYRHTHAHAQVHAGTQAPRQLQARLQARTYELGWLVLAAVDSAPGRSSRRP